MFDPAARTARSAPGALAGSREICGKIGSHRVGAWHSPVAQLVERLTVNQEVAGSSPARGANYFEHLTTFHQARPALVPLSGSTFLLPAPAALCRALPPGFRSSASTHRWPLLGIQRA